MNFLHSDLTLTHDQVVEVTLTGSSANVMLMDEANYQRYRDGQSFRYHGGHYTKSPVRLRPPYAGAWHVVVDLGETAAGGEVKAAIAVVSSAA